MSTAATRRDERVAMLIQVLNGVVYGGLLYLLAVGLVLIFGLREVVNFAHGAFSWSVPISASRSRRQDIGGAGWSSRSWHGVVGCALDAAVFRTLRRQDPMVTVLVTFGLLLILRDRRHRDLGQGLSALSDAGGLVWHADDRRGAVSGLSAVCDWRQPSSLRSRFPPGSASPGPGFTFGRRVRTRGLPPIQGINVDRLSLIVVGLGTALAGPVGRRRRTAADALADHGQLYSDQLLHRRGHRRVGSFAGAFVAAL